MKQQKKATKTVDAKIIHHQAKVAEEKSNKPAQKVFDITHPGKSIPSASSRPVIVTHKPNIADPMVSRTNQPSKDQGTTEEPTAGEGSEMIMETPKKNRIEPLHTDVSPDEADSDMPDTSDESVMPEENEPSNQAQDEVTESDNAKNEETGEISEAAAEATAKKEEQTKASKQEAEAHKQQAEVEALINNKQFFVPINAVQKRRYKEVILVVVLIILIVISLLAALDAGLLDVGVTPPTDFIQDSY